jgi:hypothetical protein
MNWPDELLNQLSSQPCCGYRRDSAIAAEPTALAALALGSWGRWDEARVAATWLADHQATDGAVGARAGKEAPHWPTGLALLAWRAFAACAPISRGNPVFQQNIHRGSAWLLAARSKPLPEAVATGHDANLVAWPWVEGTHAWIEPTAMSVLGLKACGFTDHPRTREAVRLLLNRQLPTGGCNYGNTTVLGRTLRAHVQPTGLALLALAGEVDANGTISRSADFLCQHTSVHTTTTSLAWAILGLCAHARCPVPASDWLLAAAERGSFADRSPLKMSLLLLAEKGIAGSLLELVRTDRTATLPQS